MNGACTREAWGHDTWSFEAADSAPDVRARPPDLLVCPADPDVVVRVEGTFDRSSAR